MAESTLLAVLLIAALILLGKWIRWRWRLLAQVYLPSSIIAGVIALLLGPQVLGRFGAERGFENGLWNETVLNAWSAMPGLLISVVFAALFLGKAISPPREIWRKAGPMVAHGQTLAWGQYVVGLSLVMLLLTPMTGIDPMAGALIEIGFEGVTAPPPVWATPSANWALPAAPTWPWVWPPSAWLPAWYWGPC